MQNQQMDIIHVRVGASVVRPEYVSSEETNTFDFYFTVDMESKDEINGDFEIIARRHGHYPPPFHKKTLPRVLPSTEQEAFACIEHYPLEKMDPMFNRTLEPDLPFLS